MRNRFVAALFLTALLAPNAFADRVVAPQAVWDYVGPLTWRTHTSTGDPNDQGFIDSVVVRATRAVGLATADTLAPFPLEPFALPPLTARGLSQGTDSTSTGFVFYMQPTRNTSFTPGEDSIYVLLQVSIDAVNWVGVTVTQGPGALNLNGGAESFAPVLEIGTSHCFALPYKLLTDDAAATGGISLVFSSSVTDMTWFGWRYARLIVGGDYTGEYEAYIGYWANKEQK